MFCRTPSPPSTRTDRTPGSSCLTPVTAAHIVLVPHGAVTSRGRRPLPGYTPDRTPEVPAPRTGDCLIPRGTRLQFPGPHSYLVGPTLPQLAHTHSYALTLPSSGATSTLYPVVALGVVDLITIPILNKTLLLLVTATTLTPAVPRAS